MRSHSIARSIVFAVINLISVHTAFSQGTVGNEVRSSFPLSFFVFFFANSINIEAHNQREESVAMTVYIYIYDYDYYENVAVFCSSFRFLCV
jgi:hypothetical protein